MKDYKKLIQYSYSRSIITTETKNEPLGLQASAEKEEK